MFSQLAKRSTHMLVGGSFKQLRTFGFDSGMFSSPRAAELTSREKQTIINVNMKHIKNLVKFPHSPLLLFNKSVFPMAMYCFCHCFLYSRTERIM